MSARTRQLGDIEREVLKELSGADLLYGFLLSSRSTKRLFKLARERAAYRYRRKRAIERLRLNGFLSISNDLVRITDRGSRALEIMVARTTQLLHTSRKWDRKWRIVAFDIPESRKRVRDRIRGILKRTGFKQLQQSLWVFPYECPELISLIQEESRLKQHILYGVLEHIEGDTGLRKQFGLQK